MLGSIELSTEQRRVPLAHLHCPLGRGCISKCPLRGRKVLAMMLLRAATSKAAGGQSKKESGPGTFVVLLAMMIVSSAMVPAMLLMDNPSYAIRAFFIALFVMFMYASQRDTRLKNEARAKAQAEQEARQAEADARIARLAAERLWNRLQKERRRELHRRAQWSHGR